MATENLQQAGPQPGPSSTPQELRIVAHSPLFYWWPVWAIGFIMGTISLFSGYRMAVVPGASYKAELVGSADVKREGSDTVTTVEGGTNVIVPPVGRDLQGPGVTVSPAKTPGVLFCAVLLAVITITNIQLRGLWSIIVIVVIVSLVIILALAGAWEWILEKLNVLDIRISTGGYFVTATILFIIWAIVFFFFDPQIYMVFTPGAFRVRLEIGEGEKSYDTRGMTYEKVRSDFFRHWILGLGSGDLIIRTSGAQAHQFDLHNVLFITRKVRIIEDMLRTTHVVTN